jgi:hypothetical protein
MPNWVTNKGYIELPDDASDEAKEVYDKLVANESPDGWFSNVLLCPEEMRMKTGEQLDTKWLRKRSKFKGRFGTFKAVKQVNGGTAKIFKPSKDYVAYLESEYGRGQSDWYSWNVANYGTKWDVKLTYNSVYNNRFEFEFDSAWSPPKKFFDWLSKLGIDFDLNYEEPGCQFYGTYSSTNGKLTDEYYEGEDYIIYAIDSLDQEAESLLNLSEYSSYNEFKEATEYKSKRLLRIAKDYYES